MNNYIKINSKLGKFHLNVQLKLVNGINCLFGPSGSGKTSIINCITRLIKPEFAKITINNFMLNNTEENFLSHTQKKNRVCFSRLKVVSSYDSDEKSNVWR